jgi:hypothetical protein
MRGVGGSKFEPQVAQQEDVMRFKAAEPSHGDTWQLIAKDDNNGGKVWEKILELVAATLH